MLRFIQKKYAAEKDEDRYVFLKVPFCYSLGQ